MERAPVGARDEDAALMGELIHRRRYPIIGSGRGATTLPGNANANARAELDWTPRSWRDGFAEVFS